MTSTVYSLYLIYLCYTEPDMNEDSSRVPQKHGLKNEWSLLVHSFIESSDHEKETFYTKVKNSGLQIADLKLHTKQLSQDRKKLNQQIEKIKHDLDRLTSVIENLELVGSDVESVHFQIEKLNLSGEKISADVFEIEKKIKKIREIQEIISVELNSLNHSVL